MVKYLRNVSFILFLFISFSFAAPPKNVIVLIGDGMGPEQVKAAGMYAHGTAGTLSFECLPYQAECTTYSADNPITDSAAAGTAIATGRKVNNDVISMAYPGDGHELQTLLEYFKAQGKSTGLITTVYISHATPATFGAHEPDRGNESGIIKDYLNQTRPDVLMGGAKNITAATAAAAGYKVVTNRDQMLALDTNSVSKVWGQYGKTYMGYESDGTYKYNNYPHLREMTATTLDILDNDPDGFFLMVEGGQIDRAGHAGNLVQNIGETIEFSNAVQIVLDWSAGRTDTLVIVTADHETGGLIVLQNKGQGVYPMVKWTGGGSHTGVNVPVYATGVNAKLVSGIMDNTDFFYICTSNLNTRPLADAGPDQTVYAWIDGMAQVQLDGTGSYDADGDELSYSWYVDTNNMIAVGVEPNVWFMPGDYQIDLVVNDGIEDSEPNSCMVTVIEPLQTDVQVMPKTLNLKRHHRQIMARLTLPEGVGLDDIDATQSLLLWPSEVEPLRQSIFEASRRTAIMAFYDIDAIRGLSGGTTTELTLTIRLKSGQVVYGSDSVRVISP